MKYGTKVLDDALTRQGVDSENLGERPEGAEAGRVTAYDGLVKLCKNGRKITVVK